MLKLAVQNETFSSFSTDFSISSGSFKAKVHNLSRPTCASFRLQFTFSIKMGNLKSSLSAIAAENCAQTFSFSFGNGRQFPATTVGPLAIQPRVNTNLLTAAFNDDLTGKL